jgi:hypothetical protein
MAKELPYFRFTVQEWQNGDISLESYELKGLFIDICSYYWVKDCCVTIDNLKKKFRDNQSGIDSLISENIIKSDGINICIGFLDSQMEELTNLSEKRKKAGAKGGKKLSKWSDTERNKGNQIYVLAFSNENELFIKVGVTEISIADRYSVPNGYEITTLYQVFDCNCVGLEIDILNKINDFKYVPLNKFGGYSECFNIDSIYEIESYFNKIGIKPIVNLEQTISKLKPNLNQIISYKDNNKDKDNNNNRSFVADANQDEKQFRKYLFDTIKEKQSSRDVLFKNNNIDLSLRNELWESFIKNAILNTPLIENDKHAWNTFKKYVTDNKNDFILKAKFEGFE